ncbi:hypothetical protein [Niabella ginsengisoli]|uniref:HEPN domain-containing protein n=1 Tax=Niabella ginsengisoli TaxID=522298 RepID=A0ABS9SJT2_9BACT|nr:hypothetical protein [Niabella ginsengisoli]MCH5598628.1 hypothetical protein [Niabella ginsengisoli]
MDLFFNPEIERRKQLNTLPENFMLIAAQAIFFPDGRPHIVRLNEEVSAEVKVKKGVDTSSPNFWANIDEVEHVKLNETEFLNCGHSTLILFKDGYQLTFDFQYNKQLSNEHLAVAKEFLEVSKYSLEKNLLYAFLDNAFSTIELLAKTNLFLETNKSVLGRTNHSTIKSEFNKRFKNSQNDFETERREAFNKLSNIRAKARYLEGQINIEKGELTSIFEIVEKMFLELSNRTKFNHS